MPTLVAIMIPTRKRVAKLERCIRSILDTASNPGQVEVVIRADEDDPDTLNFLDHSPLMGRLSCRVEIAERLGWGNIDIWFDEESNRLTSDWVCTFNDDMWMEGKGWDGTLSTFPKDGVIAQPENITLGPSSYHHVQGAFCPFIPRLCWVKMGEPHLKRGSDTWLDQLIRVNHHWTTRFINGLMVHHDREIDETLTKERF